MVLTDEPPDPSRVPSGCRIHARFQVPAGDEAERAGVIEAYRARDPGVLSGDGTAQVACQRVAAH